MPTVAEFLSRFMTYSTTNNKPSTVYANANPNDSVAYGTVAGYGTNITDFFAERRIGWTVWVFHPIWMPNLLADWSYTPAQGTFIGAAAGWVCRE